MKKSMVKRKKTARVTHEEVVSLHLKQSARIDLIEAMLKQNNNHQKYMFDSQDEITDSISNRLDSAIKLIDIQGRINKKFVILTWVLFGFGCLIYSMLT